MHARRVLRSFLPAALFLMMGVAPPRVFATPPACPGDCDGSGDVTVDEVVTMVNIALGGAAASGCTAGDSDGSGSITVDEIITAVSNALGGCSGPQPTATKDTSDTPTPVDTATPTLTPTAAEAETETPEPTETESSEPTESETPAATITNGMMPFTPTAEVSPTATPVDTSTPEGTPTEEPEPTEPTESEPTETTEPEPTETSIVVPTDTPQSMPTSTPGSGGGTTIDLSSANASAGSTVAVTATLSGGNDLLTATSNDIFYDTARVRVVQNGGVACTINPQIGQTSPLAKMLLLSTASQGNTIERLRIGLISFSNSLAVPDGLLFTCQFEVTAAAPAGVIVLENHAEGSNAEGNAVDIGGNNGMINVE